MPTLSIAQFTDALKTKITSRDAFYDLLKQAGIASSSSLESDSGFSYRYSHMNQTTPSVYTDYFNNMPRDSGTQCLRVWDQWRSERQSRVPQHLWWYIRERMRMAFGVYPEPTDILSTIGSKYQVSALCAHISVEDPAMVAYTASASDGEADRQVRTTLGKFLKKHFILLTDEEIQHMDASHRADLSSELELLTGKDNILDVYRNMEGDNGCMRYSGDHFGIGRDRHPSNVYDAPGFAVAVMRDTQGRFKARAMTWTNPADPTDKRYIRVYGDGALERRLERNGFAMKHLAGAVLKRIALQTDERNSRVQVVMPYIDGPGGNGNDPESNGRFGLLLDDGIKLLTREERNQIVEATDDRYAAPGLTITEGKTWLTKLPANWGSYTCSVSGKEFNRQEHKPVPTVLTDGTIGDANAAEVEARSYVKVRNCGSIEWVWVSPTAPVFNHINYTWYESAENRSYWGFHKLDAGLYPDEQEWLTGDTETVDIGSFEYIKKADSVRLIDQDGIASQAHITQVPEGYVKLWKYESRPVFAHPESGFTTTRSGCKVHAALHDLKRLYDGSFEFERNTKQTAFFGRSCRVHKDDEQFDYDVTLHTAVMDDVRTVAARTVAARADGDYALRVIRGRATNNQLPIVVTDGVFSVGYRTSSMQPQNEIAALRSTIAAIEAAEDTAFGTLTGITEPAKYARWWARSIKALLDKFDEARAEYVAASAVLAAPAPQGESRFATARFSLAA